MSRSCRQSRLELGQKKRLAGDALLMRHLPLHGSGRSPYPLDIAVLTKKGSYQNSERTRLQAQVGSKASRPKDETGPRSIPTRAMRAERKHCHWYAAEGFGFAGWRY
jgi:hypothetical protein